MLTLRRQVWLRLRAEAKCPKTLATRAEVALNSDEYSAEPQYPEIKDTSFKARKLQQAQSWHEEIRAVPTVEEKQIKINMPRYYGYKVVELTDAKFPYNCLPAIQHYTRTVFEGTAEATAPVSADALTTEQGIEQKKFEAIVEATKAEIIDSLEFSHDFFSCDPSAAELEPKEREDRFAQIVVEQMNRKILNALMDDYPHLKEAEIDYNPRHEAFWFVGGIDPPKAIVKLRKGDWQKDMAKDSVNRQVQYLGSPYLALRHRQQLAPWKTPAESENLEQAKAIPRFNYDARTLGYTTNYRHGTNIPGFWPGSPYGFGSLSYHSRSHMLARPVAYGIEDFREALHAQAMQVSYGWLMALATYNGFDTFNDVTYPMNTQTIITNGRLWSFYEYQLNTVLVHGPQVDENPRMNFCRGTDEQSLYQEFDAKTGQCVGFNEAVLRQLLKFYVNAPVVKRSAAELQPYLNPKLRYAKDYTNPEQRSFVEKTFKHLMSNRPRHLAIPETYMWEKIYKIDNNTRPMEAKRRFFELKINPWQRTLDQHDREYVPKILRPDDPKGKRKFRKTFYP